MRGKLFNGNLQRMKYIFMDFVCTAIAFEIFNMARYKILGLGSTSGSLCEYIGSDKIIVETVIIPLLLLGLYWLSGFYNNPFRRSRVTELGVTLGTAVFATAIIYLALLINDSSGFRRKDYQLIIILYVVLSLVVYCGRLAITTSTLRKLRKRKWKYITLMIGSSKKSLSISRKLKNSGSVWMSEPIGFIRLPGEKGFPGSSPCWDFEQVEMVCNQYGVDELVLVPSKSGDTEIMKILDRLFPLNLPVRIAPDTLSYVTANIRLNDIKGMPFVDLTTPNLGACRQNIKRILDITVSALMLIMLSPFMAAVYALVRCTSEGPGFYKQTRIGYRRKPFFIYKFRSMRTDAEKNGPALSSDHDPRVTRIGRIMRKYRIDELPQFWNVLTGDMSLVGPRPEREHYLNQIIKQAPYYSLLFQVRPGITSWGMVKYGYATNVAQMVKRSRYDLIYVNNMSISNDVKILIYTVGTVLKGRGK